MMNSVTLHTDGSCLRNPGPGGWAAVLQWRDETREISGAVADTTEPIRGIRKAMFAQMVAANAIPHFSYCDEVRMDGLMAVRQQLKPLAEQHGIPKFTLMPLMLKATSLALAEFPELNSSVSG